MGEKIEYPFTYSILTFDYTDVEQKYQNFLKKYKPTKLLKDKQIYQTFIKNFQKIKLLQ